ncbi:MAG: molybdopterin-binding protein [Bacillota bacterium]
MRQVRIEEAIGLVLGHDLTRIVPGEFKGPAFKRGHIIRREDLPKLLSMGKEHVFVMELGPGQLHEDDAVTRMASALCGPHTMPGAPAEGRVSIQATSDGLFKVDREAVHAINACGELSVATLHSNVPVKQGELLAGARVFPLVIQAEKVEAVEQLGRSAPVLQVLPYRHRQAYLIITGNEVLHGRIADGFGRVVVEKLAHFPCRIIGHTIVGDDREAICSSILAAYRDGAGLILVTGGMSVDPDDRTPGAISATGAEVVIYGTPVLPGSMLMLAYLEDVPVVGLPGCVMYNPATVFDLILPRLFTGERLTRGDFAQMAVGGLCAGCSECRYPNCRFGKCC